MILGTGSFDLYELDAVLKRALMDACVVTVDEAFNSLEALADGSDFAQTPMAAWLPQKHLLRFDAGFARCFLVCLVAVAGKLADRDPHVLGSVAEEMALAAILDEAEAILETSGGHADMRAVAQSAFQDADFEILFNPELDGLEEDESIAHLALTNLRFKDWFTPFRDEVPVHPYVAEA
jgi:hypothetical protein